MKPRLEAAPWTTEDDQILWRRTLRVGKREQTWCQAFDCRPQDRRDADLMLSWQCQEMETLHMSRLERWAWLGIGPEVQL